MTLDELRMIFTACEKPMEVEDLLKAISMYGPDIAFFPMMLKALSGKVLECFVQEGAFGWVDISIL
jgi:hypothetical protein